MQIVFAIRFVRFEAAVHGRNREASAQLVSELAGGHARLARTPKVEHEYGADARAARDDGRVGVEHGKRLRLFAPQRLDDWCLRVRDLTTVELWDGTSLHAVVDSPVAAVRLSIGSW